MRAYHLGFLTLLMLIFLIGDAFAVKGHGAVDVNVSLNAEASKALASAIDRFRGDGYPFDGYSISIRQGGDEIEVVFIPPLKITNNMIGMEKSGLPEVHYYFDGSGTKIIKRLFGM